MKKNYDNLNFHSWDIADLLFQIFMVWLGQADYTQLNQYYVELGKSTSKQKIKKIQYAFPKILKKKLGTLGIWVYWAFWYFGSMSEHTCLELQQQLRTLLEVYLRLKIQGNPTNYSWQIVNLLCTLGMPRHTHPH